MRFEMKDISPAAIHAMWLMDDAGFEARICGGAVRDLVQSAIPKDWDIATTATPDRVMEIMQSHNIHVIPTGLQHGTVTAVIGGEPIEITTLRVDVATDGRHAEVEFTTDWEQDSLRRDFTMNAMYLDLNLNVIDFHGGMKDIDDGQLRFVGDAGQRIREDYLRILRFFRFRARMARTLSSVVTDHAPTFAIIKEHADGLTGISGERIWSELTKILMTDSKFAMREFYHMKETDVLKAIGLESATRIARFSDSPDKRPAVKLAIAMTDINATVKVLRDRFKVSREELDPIVFVAQHQNVPVSRINAFQMMSRHSKSDVQAWITLNHYMWKESVQSSNTLVELNTMYNMVRDTVVPEFPVTGQDLLDMGFTPGPQFGKTLQELRQVWADTEFSAARSYLLTLIHQTNGHIK